jgi:hypothetical protein
MAGAATARSTLQTADWHRTLTEAGARKIAVGSIIAVWRSGSRPRHRPIGTDLIGTQTCLSQPLPADRIAAFAVKITILSPDYQPELP